LDAVGAAPQDAALRSAALRGAGGTVRALAIGGQRAVADRAPIECAAGPARVADDAACREAVHSLSPRFTPDLAIVASAIAAPATTWLPPGMRCAWWPTGLLAPDDTRAALHDMPALIPPATADILDGAPAEPATSGRSQLPLWDGDYVLAAGPLSGVAGHAALAAFAAVAEDHAAHDFVVLADPQPEFEAAARALGVGARVHFAGAARREAEHAWFRSAAALLIAGDAPLSAALLLRALACRAPVLPIGAAGVPAVVADWLEARRCLAAPRDAADAARLESVLAPSAATRHAIESGASLAAGHEPGALARRVAAALETFGRDAAAA